MNVSFKNLVLCSAILSCGIMNNVSDAAGWNRNNNFGVFNNNNVMQNNNMQFNNNAAPAPLSNNNFNNNMQWNRNNNWNNNQNNYNNNFVMQNGNFKQNNNIQWNQNNFNNNQINMNWNRNNNWNNNQNNFNNNNIMQKNMQQFLINKTLNNKDKIATNWQNVNKYDWQLFRQNITQSPSARTSAIRALRSLFVGDGAQNFNSQDEAERLARFECANCIGGLISFHAGDYNNALKVAAKSSELELLTMIANYYITNLASGYNISLVQNNLRSFNNLPTLLSTLGYQSYYQQYFMPRYSNTLRQYNDNGNGFVNSFLPNTITWQDWNKAVTIAQNIDLAGSLKKLVKGINIANYFECNRKYAQQTNNSQVVLSNGVGKCAFNTMFQLLSSGLQKMKYSNTVSPITTGYFADFDKYLRGQQASNGKSLVLIDELWKFEKTLSKDALEIWNNDGKVLQAKNKLKKMQNNFSNESWMTVLGLFSKIFPELREIYDENDYVNIFMDNDCNSEQFYKVDPSRNYLFFSGSGNSGFGVLDKGIRKNMLFNNINNNQYMIWFDKQGNMSLYELTGLQLSAPGHNVAYAKYDNSAFNWRVVNSAGESSNYGIQLGGIFQDARFQNLKAVGGVGAYMFKKVSSQEFLQYMPQGLVL